MEVVFWLGRILFGGFFLFSGLRIFVHLRERVDRLQSKGVPLPGLAAVATGAMLVVGGMAVLSGYQLQAGLWLIVLFLVVASPTVLNFWNVHDPVRRAYEQNNFFKNMALVGASLLLLALWR